MRIVAIPSSTATLVKTTASNFDLYVFLRNGKIYSFEKLSHISMAITCKKKQNLFV